jgi:hypothetical protein
MNRALADASGAVQTQYTFEPFGATSVAGATNTNAVQFTGRENDGTVASTNTCTRAVARQNMWIQVAWTRMPR